MKYTVIRTTRKKICVGCALISERRGFNQAYFYFIRRRRLGTLRWGSHPTTKDLAWEAVLRDSETYAYLGSPLFIRDKEDE